MCEVFEEIKQEGIQEGRQEGRQEGVAETLLETVLSLMKNMNIAANKAMDLLDVPEANRAAILEQIN